MGELGFVVLIVWVDVATCQLCSGWKRRRSDKGNVLDLVSSRSIVLEKVKES
jgi:hypothetical protein